MQGQPCVCHNLVVCTCHVSAACWFVDKVAKSGRRSYVYVVSLRDKGALNAAT